MADMALSREAKVVLSIPASSELASAWMVNSDRETSVMVPNRALKPIAHNPSAWFELRRRDDHIHGTFSVTAG
jgi:hypothetical protein